jgi:hypothetical protein
MSPVNHLKPDPDATASGMASPAAANAVSYSLLRLLILKDGRRNVKPFCFSFVEIIKGE